jgi:hypothetical protein
MPRVTIIGGLDDNPDRKEFTQSLRSNFGGGNDWSWIKAERAWAWRVDAKLLKQLLGAFRNPRPETAGEVVVLFRLKDDDKEALRNASRDARSSSRPTLHVPRLLNAPHDVLRSDELRIWIASNVAHDSDTAESQIVQYAVALAAHFDERVRLNSSSQGVEFLGVPPSNHEALAGIRDKPNTLVDRMQLEPSLAQCLDIIEWLFPDRVIALDNARTSANASSEFEFGLRALGHLATLCGPFWRTLSTGRGTLEAKTVLGNAYASNESETAGKNKKAQELRTFIYQGERIEMMQHLKIGAKESPSRTWRCHFHWDAERRKIVIGHCGRHLDLC